MLSLWFALYQPVTRPIQSQNINREGSRLNTEYAFRRRRDSPESRVESPYICIILSIQSSITDLNCASAASINQSCIYSVLVAIKIGSQKADMCICDCTHLYSWIDIPRPTLASRLSASPRSASASSNTVGLFIVVTEYAKYSVHTIRKSVHCTLCIGPFG